MIANKLYLLIAVMLITIASCTKEEPQNYLEAPTTNTESAYLEFTSQIEFDDVIQSYIAFENGYSVETKSIGRKTAKGFTSIAELQQACLTKSGADSEEMTQDEFNIMQAKLLLPDPVLCYVLDTTLRIVVGDDFYKITPYGTFATHKGNEDELYAAIENFEQTKQSLNITEDDSVVDITPSVKFINTFRNNPIKSNIVNDAEEEFDDNLVAVADDDVLTKAAGAENYYAEYNVDSYKWSSKTVVGKWMDKLFGTSASRDRTFSSDKKMSFEVFDVNYGFFTSMGMKVKMQKKKKFLWAISYWTDETADKIVVGFDMLKIKVKLTKSVVPEKPKSDAEIVNAILGNNIKPMVYKGFNGSDFLQDFSKEVYSFIPYMNLPVGETNIENINRTIREAARDYIAASPTTVHKSMLNLAGTQLKSIGKKIEKKSPVAWYVLENTTTATTDLTNFVSGVKEYARLSEKVIRFNFAFGITVKIKGAALEKIAPYIPNSVNFSKVDVFAAAYYAGQWRGIRFYSE